ncbi:MAG: alanine racemase [Desulfobacteraceae bacterium]|nr:alanine racemase [Desulfobacteraceae bacterium]
MVPYDVWAEIDLSAVAHNVRALKGALSSGTRLMAVVKADGYGHGAVAVARQALAAGADCLAVARIGEALELRYAGIKGPILIFGHTPPALTRKLLEYDLTQTVSSFTDAEAFSARSADTGARLRVHINIDTGMGRLGVLGMPPDGANGFSDAVAEVAAICGLQGLAAEGIYTHFATADSADKSDTRGQLELFEQILSRLRDLGVVFSVRHAANSAAAMEMPETHLDMVRPGISIYGHYPSQETECCGVELTPAMTVRARIVHLKRVGPGFRVSYGWTEQTMENTLIATVPIGYADGFFRLLSSRGFMRVRGYRAPVIGRVCMDHTMLDVGHVPGVACGDAALVFGRDADGDLPVESVAGTLDTINYEVLSRISSRIPRVYIKGGR